MLQSTVEWLPNGGLGGSAREQLFMSFLLATDTVYIFYQKLHNPYLLFPTSVTGPVKMDSV